MQYLYLDDDLATNAFADYSPVVPGFQPASKDMGWGPWVDDAENKGTEDVKTANEEGNLSEENSEVSKEGVEGEEEGEGQAPKDEEPQDLKSILAAERLWRREVYERVLEQCRRLRYAISDDDYDILVVSQMERLMVDLLDRACDDAAASSDSLNNGSVASLMNTNMPPAFDILDAFSSLSDFVSADLVHLSDMCHMKHLAWSFFEEGKRSTIADTIVQTANYLEQTAGTADVST
ncbi:hypothetical protein HK102_001748, partial [Quaeritorhiza haematococci]